MGVYFEQIPAAVRDHLKGITKSSGLPAGDESLEMMSEAWLGKQEAFEREISARDMEVVDSLDKDDPRGAVVMTYSGSLINIGPLTGDGRSTGYSSIGLRTDVPDILDCEAAMLARDVENGNEVEFDEGPVSRTSAAFQIAVCKDDLSVEDQEEELSNVTMVLTQEFADINKTLVID